MKNFAYDQERARAVIRSACTTLEYIRNNGPTFGISPAGLDDDLAVLLRDATRIFCDSMEAVDGEPQVGRWSHVLAERLFSHPEQCDEILARAETGPLLVFPAVPFTPIHQVAVHG